MADIDFTYAQWSVLFQLDQYHGLNSFKLLAARIKENCYYQGASSEKFLLNCRDKNFIPDSLLEPIAKAFRCDKDKLLNIINSTIAPHGLELTTDKETFKHQLQQHYQDSLKILPWQLEIMLKEGCVVHGFDNFEKLNNQLSTPLKDCLQSGTWPELLQLGELAERLKIKPAKALVQLLWHEEVHEFTPKIRQLYQVDTEETVNAPNWFEGVKNRLNEKVSLGTALMAALFLSSLTMIFSINHYYSPIPAIRPVWPEHQAVIIQNMLISVAWTDNAASEHQDYVIEQYFRPMDASTYQHEYKDAHEVTRTGNRFSSDLNLRSGEYLWAIHPKADGKPSPEVLTPFYSKFTYWRNQLERIKTTRKLQVAVTTSEEDRFMYMENGSYKGFDIDLVEYIAAKLGEAIEINYINTEWDQLFTTLSTDQADIAISSITNLNKRKNAFTEFTTGYFFPTQVLFQLNDDSRKPVESDISALVKGKIIGVVKGSSNQLLAEALMKSGKFNFSLKPDYANIASLQSALESRKIDLMLTDCQLVRSLSKGNLQIAGIIPENDKADYLKNHIDPDADASEHYVIVVRADNDHSLNHAISGVINSVEGQDKLNALNAQYFPASAECVKP